MIGDLLLKNFLKETAANTPVPGGGSVAALSASLAAALGEMVANLTTSKKKYKDVWKELDTLSNDMKKKREELIACIDKDADAYCQVMDAYKLDPDKDKGARDIAIQKAMKHAAEVPLEVAKMALELMSVLETVIEKGNKNAVTDGLVGVMMARTAALAAILNVNINLQSITDTSYCNKLAEDVSKLKKNVTQMEAKILEKHALL